jgi:hypothetical protein
MTSAATILAKANGCNDGENKVETTHLEVPNSYDKLLKHALTMMWKFLDKIRSPKLYSRICCQDPVMNFHALSTDAKKKISSSHFL